MGNNATNKRSRAASRSTLAALARPDHGSLAVRDWRETLNRYAAPVATDDPTVGASVVGTRERSRAKRGSVVVIDRAATRLDTIVQACARPMGDPRYVSHEVVATIIRALAVRCDRAVLAAVVACDCDRPAREDSGAYRSGEKIRPEAHGAKCRCGAREDRLYRAAIRAICTARPDSGCVPPAFKNPLQVQLDRARRASSMLAESVGEESIRPESADVYESVLANAGFETRERACDAGLHATASAAGKRRVSGKRGAQRLIQGYHTSFATEETPRRTLAAICTYKRLPVPTVPEALLLARRVARAALAARAWLKAPCARPCDCAGCVADMSGPRADSRTCAGIVARESYNVAVGEVNAWYTRAVADARNATCAPRAGGSADSLVASAIRPEGEKQRGAKGERTFVLTRNGMESYACHALTVDHALRTLLPLAGVRLDAASGGICVSDAFACGTLTLATRNPGARALETSAVVDVRAALGRLSSARNGSRRDAAVIARIVARTLLERSIPESSREWTPILASGAARIARLDAMAREIRGRIWALTHGATGEGDTSFMIGRRVPAGAVSPHGEAPADLTYDKSTVRCDPGFVASRYLSDAPGVARATPKDLDGGGLRARPDHSWQVMSALSGATKRNAHSEALAEQEQIASQKRRNASC